MKGSPARVAKRRLHETPREFAEAEVGKQSYDYQRWQARCERAAARDHARVMPAHHRPLTKEESRAMSWGQDKGRMGPKPWDF